MSFAVVADPPPLATGPDGVIRVAGTRVTLDTLVVAYLTGATAESIAEQYPAVGLADVYFAIGYYLRHTAEVEEYLRQRQSQAEAIRHQNETRFPPCGVRKRLLGRWKPGS